jgi:acetyl esterase/lipase
VEPAARPRGRLASARPCNIPTARAARAYLAARGDVDPARLVHFGESLGAAVAVQLAVERPPMALVLRSPFTSLADVGRIHYRFLPVRWLLRDRYASIEQVGGLRSPASCAGRWRCWWRGTCAWRAGRQPASGIVVAYSADQSPSPWEG